MCGHRNGIAGFAGALHCVWRRYRKRNFRGSLEIVVDLFGLQTPVAEQYLARFQFIANACVSGYAEPISMAKP